MTLLLISCMDNSRKKIKTEVLALQVIPIYHGIWHSKHYLATLNT
jgi:hypothetical protein